MSEFKEKLKGYFVTNAKPTEQQFAELIDRGLYLDEDGNLGIGTDEPEGKLHIVGGGNVTPTSGGALIIGEISGQNMAIDRNEIMARNQNGTAPLYLQNNGGHLRVHNAVEGTEVVILDDGKVGIGTKSPGEKLEVNGRIKTHGIELREDIRRNGVPVMGFLESPLLNNGVAAQIRAKTFFGVFLNGSMTLSIPHEIVTGTNIIIGVIPSSRAGTNRFFHSTEPSCNINVVEVTSTDINLSREEGSSALEVDVFLFYKIQPLVFPVSG